MYLYFFLSYLYFSCIVFNFFNWCLMAVNVWHCSDNGGRRHYCTHSMLFFYYHHCIAEKEIKWCGFDLSLKVESWENWLDVCVCCVCWSVVRLVNIVTLCVFFLICIHFFWSLCCFSVGLANQLDELFNWILLCVRPSDWTLWNETLSIVANCSRTIRFDERFFFLSVLSQYIYLLAMKNWWMQRGHFFGRHVKRHRRGLQLSQIN